jgi:hypothetical protein
MENYTMDFIELDDTDLDHVAGGGNCGCGGGTNQIGLVNVNNTLNHNEILSDNNVAVAVVV